MNNIKGRSIAALLAAFLLVQPGVATVSAMPTQASAVSTSSETPEEETLVTSLFASFLLQGSPTPRVVQIELKNEYKKLPHHLGDGC